MAEHRAEQITDRVKTLVTGLTTTGANVDRGRAEEIPAESTPALRVAMGDDQNVTPWAQQLIDSDLDVIIGAKVHDSATNVETLLTRIRKEVNVALVADFTLGLAFVQAIVEVGASRPQLSGDVAKPTASIELRYLVRYRRSRTDPSA